MKHSKKLALSALLIALALGLSYTERFLPLQLVIPLPGIKLGLANIVALIALYLLGVKNTLPIVVLRCVMGAVFGGGISGLLFSLIGGLLALWTMWLSRKLPFLSLYGISIFGAAAHNIGQICAAMVLLQTPGILGYLPYLLVTAVFTGLATGGAAAGVLKLLPGSLAPRKTE